MTLKRDHKRKLCYKLICIAGVLMLFPKHLHEFYGNLLTI